MRGKFALGFVGLAGICVVGFVLGQLRPLFGDSAVASRSTEIRPVVQADVDALADGVVTEVEYRAAFDRWVSCVEASGATVDGPVTADRFGHLSVPMRGPSGIPASQLHEKAQELLRARTECHATYLSPIELKWNESHRPGEQDDSEAREFFAACLRERGVAIADPPNKSAVRAAMEYAMANELGRGPSPAIDCAIKTQQDLGLPGWSGG
jgi:hypothetical protein